MKEAHLYHKLEDLKVQCLTCAHQCVLADGKRGICGVRENHEGKLISLVYGKAIAMHVDPIEKKPLFHFMPGSQSFSIATVGCNMHCDNCQNADISQMPRDKNTIHGQDIRPSDIINAAVKADCRTIAYTYTEPAVYWDYAFDCAQMAYDKNIFNIFVTNGYWSKEGLAGMAPFMDGANVDLKSFNDDMYKRICGARLAPVLEAIERMHTLGVWVEITTLLIPGLNDSDIELRQIAAFIVAVDPEIPWHISRFYPTYRMTDRPPTPVERIRQARQIGLEAGVKFVYTGNLPGDRGENTYCPCCGQLLIERIRYQIRENHLKAGYCSQCQTKIAGVWNT